MHEAAQTNKHLSKVATQGIQALLSVMPQAFVPLPNDRCYQLHELLLLLFLKTWLSFSPAATALCNASCCAVDECMLLQKLLPLHMPLLLPQLLLLRLLPLLLLLPLPVPLVPHPDSPQLGPKRHTPLVGQHIALIIPQLVGEATQRNA